jgi:hypothetical protein
MSSRTPVQADERSEEPPACPRGCCCLMGPGSRVRTALFIIGGIALLALIAWGFATAG